jgi:hypothetical protein
MQQTLVVLQTAVVAFVLLHDWIPLGRLSNRAGLLTADTPAKLAVTTILSSLPFAAVLIPSALLVSTRYPHWLLWWLWATYATCAYGILRAWWIPYLGPPDPERANRYAIRFAGTHAFLPMRHGMRPDTLHVGFHTLIVAILVLLACVTFLR